MKNTANSILETASIANVLTDQKSFIINSTTMEEQCNDHRFGFHYFGRYCEPHLFPRGTYPWHWHEYIQFVYVIEGRVEYLLETGTYTLRRGEGAFINSNILHSVQCDTKRRCKYVEQLFSPVFVGGTAQSEIMLNFVKPITENSAFDFFKLDPDEIEHEEILDMLSEAFEYYEKQEECYELLVRSKLTYMWAKFFLLTKPCWMQAEGQHTSSRLKAMLLFINDHHMERITLDQIAEAGTCSRRECNRTFQSQLHLTPFEYLTSIRMNKAANLLLASSITVTQISEQCGFSDPSHFTKAFKEQFGMSPKYYRQNR